MSPVALIALFGWVPFVILLFALVPARSAAVIAVIGAWLLLPPVGIAIAGLPDYTKSTAATVSIMLGTFLFAPNHILKFRPRWFDLPMVLWCFTGIASSLQNGLGLYDGLSDALKQFLTWGLPYLIGRLYFGNLEGLRAFTVGMVIGALVYVLPCLWEIKMSPQLMHNVYGMGIWQGIRLGGYRPHVFFNTGLELGMWMTAASLAAWWLWRCSAIKQIGGISFGSVLLPVLLGTTVLCRSTGALILLACGMMVLWLSTRFHTRLLLAGLLLGWPLYVTVRVTNLWSGQEAVSLADAVIGPERAESLAYRFMCENLLIARAVEQPVFGWGGWGRSVVYFDAGHRWAVAPDGIWIIYLGTKGFVGVTLFYLAMILPAALFVVQFPVRSWTEPRVAAGSLAVTLLVVYMIDCLMNGFPNIIYVTLAGGLIGLEPKQYRGGMARRDGDGRRMAALGTLATRPGPHNGQIVLADRYRGLGRSFKQEGRPVEAEAAWRQALDVLSGLLKTESDSLELRRLWCDCANDLAWLWANHPDPACRDPAAAVATARWMVEECPDADVYWNTLGVAYYRACDYTSAAAALNRATALSGGTAFDDVFLAMAHARLGDLEKARRELAQAMVRRERDYPGHPELAGFCAEAQFVLANAFETPAVIHQSESTA
jgi:hypothetical protein